MNVVDILKQYKIRKSRIKAIKLRIEGYEEALKCPEEFTAVRLNTLSEPGMPKVKGYYSNSPTEAIIIEKEKATEIIIEWKKEDESRLYPLELEVKQIDNALSSLTKWQNYIIECKYFEGGMTWRDIEISFNRQFPQKNDLTNEALRKLNKLALEQLEEILRPFYNRFNIA